MKSPFPIFPGADGPMSPDMASSESDDQYMSDDSYGRSQKFNKKGLNLRVAIPTDNKSKDPYATLPLRLASQTPQTPLPELLSNTVSTPSSGLYFPGLGTALTPNLIDTPNSNSFSQWPGWLSPRISAVSPMTPDSSGSCSSGSAGRTPTQLTPSLESSLSFVNSTLQTSPQVSPQRKFSIPEDSTSSPDKRRKGNDGASVESMKKDEKDRPLMISSIPVEPLQQ